MNGVTGNRRWWFAVVMGFVAATLNLRTASAEIWGFEGRQLAYSRFVWEYRFEEFGAEEYANAVVEVFRSFEVITGKKLEPGSKRRVGIKIYTNSGVGIATPTDLVRAVLSALKARGFSSDELFILDLSEGRMRDAGYLPPLSKESGRGRFEGVPVHILDTGDFFDPVWYYESSLPQQRNSVRTRERSDAVPLTQKESERSRKSFLPKHLLVDVDFWINLPVAMDHPSVGVSGALVNATLWNISNRERFLASPANAPVAVAEIAAIPELVSGWALTILSMERYQIIGGPVFNARYTRSKKLLWMSVNPVVIDALALRLINDGRRRERFQPIGRSLQMLRFASTLGLGTADVKEIVWLRFPEYTVDSS